MNRKCCRLCRKICVRAISLRGGPPASSAWLQWIIVKSARMPKLAHFVKMASSLIRVSASLVLAQFQIARNAHQMAARVTSAQRISFKLMLERAARARTTSATARQKRWRPSKAARLSPPWSATTARTLAWLKMRHPSSLSTDTERSMECSSNATNASPAFPETHLSSPAAPAARPFQTAHHATWKDKLAINATMVSWLMRSKNVRRRVHDD